MPSDDGNTTVGEFVDVLPKDGDWHRFNIDGHVFDAAYFGEWKYDDDGSDKGSWGPSRSASEAERGDGAAEGTGGG